MTNISSAIDANAVARVVGIKTTFADLRGVGSVLNLPQRVAIIGLGNVATTYATTKRTIVSAFEAGQTYGFGSPVHLAAKQLLPATGGGVGAIPVTIYPLADGGSATQAERDITPAGTITQSAGYRVKVANIASPVFTIALGATVAEVNQAMVAAINANQDMPVIASTDDLTTTLQTKWSGPSGTDISVVIEAETIDGGSTFAVSAATAGTVYPDVTAATDQVGDVWETLVINCSDIEDTTAIDAFNTWAESRWGALTHKPAVVFTGSNSATLTDYTTVTDTRLTQRGNAFLTAPDSKNLPFVIAASELAAIAVLANENPPHDYGSQVASSLVPGADGSQWDYVARDAAVKAGVSTVQTRNEQVTIDDVVTFYRPDGELVPGYRFVVDIVKLQNIIFNLALQFESSEWNGAPLLPNDQVSFNRTAKSPNHAKQLLAALTTQFANNALISDPAFTQDNMEVGINDTNPKRLDMRLPVKLSGNTNQLATDLDFGFFFGS